jgi:uncharacterized membrane protein YesL
MMSFLEPVRLIWKALQAWWEAWLGLLLFGLVWVLCCATLVLGPPATFGFFFAVRQWMAEKEIRWERYYRMAKNHFLASWLWFLANLLVLFLVYVNFVFYANLDSSLGGVLQVIALGTGFLWLAVQFYALPYYVLLEKKNLFIAWKNGLFTILASPLFSLALWVVLGIVLLLHLTIMPFLIGGPGLVVLLSSMAVEDRIQKFGIREKDAKQGAT